MTLSILWLGTTAGAGGRRLRRPGPLGGPSGAVRRAVRAVRRAVRAVRRADRAVGPAVRAVRAVRRAGRAAEHSSRVRHSSPVWSGIGTNRAYVPVRGAHTFKVERRGGQIP